MPELPEVETVKRGLWPQLSGRCVTAVHVAQPKLRWPIDEDRLQHTLAKARVLGLRRRAKYLLIDVMQRDAAPNVLMVHLGMTGWLGTVAADTPLRKHDHVCFALDNGRSLRFNDARRFGSITVFARPEEQFHPLLAHLGPEPLEPSAFDGAVLWQACRGAKRSIKSVLMDARAVVGVGNIYANEALYAAGVHPLMTAARLSRARAERLACEVRRVLQDAIDVGGTTLRDFRNAEGLVGMFAPRLRIYGRGHEACRACQTPVRKVVQHGRATYLCVVCQKR